MTKVNLILINAISMLNRCSVKDDQLKKWVQRQFYESIDIYIEKKRPKTYTGWWTSLQNKNDGDLLAEWDATPYIRIQKVVAPRPSKLCVSHFLCFVYLQDWRIAQMLLITHWTTERHWNKEELLSTHLVKPVSRKSNTKLKSKSAFRSDVCKIYKITNSAMGISCQHICIFNNSIGKVDHLSGS